jgi:hypothetical protein
MMGNKISKTIKHLFMFFSFFEVDMNPISEPAMPIPAIHKNASPLSGFIYTLFN